MAVTRSSPPSLTDLLFEKVSVGLCLVAPDSTIVRANSEWVRSTGFSEVQVVGKNIIDLFPAERDTALAMHARARAGHRVDVPRHARLFNRRETWWEGSIEPVPLEGGTGLLISAREVASNGPEPTPEVGADHALHASVAELAASDGPFRAMFDATSDAVILVDPSGPGCVLAANASACRLFGYTEQEFRGLRRDAMLDLGDANVTAVVAARDALGTAGGELVYRRKDGTRFTGELSTAAFRDPGGEPRAVAIIRDVTERNRAKMALAEEKEKYRSLFQHSLDAVYLTRADGTILDANPAACRLHGMTVEEIVRAGRAGLVVTDERHRAALLERATTGRARADLTVRRQDGTTVPVEVQSVLLDPGREESRAFVITHDVSARKESEEALRRAEARFRTVFESMRDEVWFVDTDRKLTLANPAVLREFLLSDGTLDAERLASTFEVLRPDGTPRPVEEAPPFRALRGEVLEQVEEIVRTPATGELRHRSVNATPVRDGSGKIVGSVSVVRDITDQVRAEDALQQSQRLLRSTMDAFPTVIAFKDREGRFLDVNPEVEKALGLSKERIIGRTLHDFIPRDAADVIARHDEEVMSSRRAIQREEVTPLPSGTLHHLNVAFPLVDGEGRVYGTGHISHDITQLKRAEDALRAVEQRLRDTHARLRTHVESTPLAVVEWDSEYRVIGYSARAQELFGWAPDEVLGKRIDEIPWVPEEDWPAVRAVMRDMLTGVRPTNVNANRNARKDGKTLYCEWYSSTLYDHTGRMTSVLSFVLDVTERKRTEEALRASERRLGLAFDAARAAAWEVDLVAGKHFWEDRFFPLLCVPPERREWAEQHWTEFVVPEDSARAAEEFARACEDGRGVYDSQFRARRMDGVVRWFRSRGVEVPETGGGRRMVGFVQDITEEKESEQKLIEANERLREADRRKDEFLGMLSHELRNPLAPIRNSIHILRHAEPHSEQSRRAKAVIERQTDHLTRLVDDLLDVTRIVRGKVELKPEFVDLREVLLHAAEDFRLMLDDRGVAFTTDLPHEPVSANVDATRVTQVVGNLLHNAFKFTRGGDDVTLSLKVEGGYGEIRVRDTGVGLEPALLPRVFEPFVQGERTLARTEGGLGLGLALVKGIAELHGGTVRAESAGKGKGSEFVVTLPVLLSPEVRSSTTARPVRRDGGRRVLVVDDNTDAADSLADIVRMLGHEVDVAYDGPTAIEKVRANAPAVVLCDIGLPGMSGYEVARKLRGIAKGDIQLFAVSGYAQPEDVKRALDAGFDGHVAKPCDPNEIERLLG